MGYDMVLLCTAEKTLRIYRIRDIYIWYCPAGPLRPLELDKEYIWYALQGQ